MLVYFTQLSVYFPHDSWKLFTQQNLTHRQFIGFEESGKKSYYKHRSNHCGGMKYYLEIVLVHGTKNNEITLSKDFLAFIIFHLSILTTISRILNK